MAVPPLSPWPSGTTVFAKEPVWQRWLSNLVTGVNELLLGIRSGEGSPEGVLLGRVGDLYRRTDAAPVLWAKETGDDTLTGWVPK
jgi:hypothetical protein